MNKNIIIGFLMGVLVVFSINAAVETGPVILKPAQPKAWIVTTGGAGMISSTIMKWSKEGYLVHELRLSTCISSSGNGYRETGILVMYKYY